MGLMVNYTPKLMNDLITFMQYREMINYKELDELINAGLSLSAASKYLAKKNNLAKNLFYNLY